MKNKVVIITGASSGIGEACALEFSKKGANLVLVARSEEKLKSVCDKINSNQSQAFYIVTDVSIEDDCKKMIEFTIDKFGTIDILINNAGTTGPMGVPGAMGYQKIDSMDYQIWRDILEVNLLSPFKIATAFHNHVARSDKKILIMMSSDLGSVEQNNFGGFYSYRASKSALNIISKGMSVDWNDVTVIALAPGWCKTYLGGDEAEIEPAESVEQQQEMFEGIAAKDSGKFLVRFGKEVAW